jgi:hypothetical protein
MNFEDYAHVSSLGQENIGVDEPVEVHLLVERARFLVIFEDALELKHW